MLISPEKIGKGQPLVLLHGWGFHKGIWKTVFEALQSSFTVHLLDFPGFGLNHHECCPENLSDFLDKILPVLPENAIYCGWSFGGLIAMGLALYAPDRVKKIITVGSTPRFLSDKNWNGVNEKNFQRMYMETQNNPKKSLMRFLSIFLENEKNTSLERAELLKIMFHFGTPNQSSLLSMLKILYNSDLREKIKKNDCPMLHLVGEKDFLAPSNLEFPHKVILGAGHFPFITHSDVFLRHIKDFSYE